MNIQKSTPFLNEYGENGLLIKNTIKHLGIKIETHHIKSKRRLKTSLEVIIADNAYKKKKKKKIFQINNLTSHLKKPEKKSKLNLKNYKD